METNLDKAIPNHILDASMNSAFAWEVSMDVDEPYRYVEGGESEPMSLVDGSGVPTCVGRDDAGPDLARPGPGTGGRLAISVLGAPLQCDGSPRRHTWAWRPTT